MRRPIGSIRVGVILTLVLLSGGCARNVERIEFTKWGHSYVPRGSSVDTSAQGGAAQDNVIPSSPNVQAPKASVGGTYHRTFATSQRYRMVAGFHVTPPAQ